MLFFGTPAFAVPTLERLASSTHQIVGVVTQPDRPRGRGQKVQPEAVKRAADARGLPVIQPERLGDQAFVGVVEALTPDLGVVAAYGKILPQRIIDLPRRGLINVHASLLPRWRGAAPVHRAILAGDQQTGVTIMRVALALDAGPMLARATVEIGPDETSAELEARLATLGAELLVETVDRLARGPVTEAPQDERLVTYAGRLTRRESEIDWARPAAAIHNQIRGLQPWPLAGASLGGRRVAFLKSAVASSGPVTAPPATVVSVDPTSFTVASKPGAVRILAIQEAGRAPMSVREFLNGRRVLVGDAVGPLPEAPA
ncbi:MAG: methionyl-tRNA formyltransferase [Vicinamibacterales bacterium]